MNDTNEREILTVTDTEQDASLWIWQTGESDRPISIEVGGTGVSSSYHYDAVKFYLTAEQAAALHRGLGLALTVNDNGRR